MIRITPAITLDDSEISESFTRASGPGGQNVNKVSTAVELRFDVAHSPALPEDVRARLMTLAGRRLTQDGILIIQVQSHRSQDRNRQEARERLTALIRRAAEQPRRRRATRPTAGSKARRLKAKTVRSGIKALRQTKPTD
jgi:ribosome-associated protein